MEKQRQAYDAFAPFYDGMGMNRFSEAWGVMLCSVLEGRDLSKVRLLDMACGTGSFCDFMAQRGVSVTGFDLSSAMVEAAQQKKIPGARFFAADMTDFEAGGDFDIVTCNYDSLNHLLSERQVERAFQNAYRGLATGGMFCFDVNTIVGLERWNYQDLHHNEHSVMLRHGVYDERTHQAILVIDGFAVRADGLYSRFQESIREAAYSLVRLQELLREAGFVQAEPIGNSAAKSMSELEQDPRVFFKAVK